MLLTENHGDYTMTTNFLNSVFSSSELDKLPINSALKRLQTKLNGASTSSADIERYDRMHHRHNRG